MSIRVSSKAKSLRQPSAPPPLEQFVAERVEAPASRRSETALEALRARDRIRLSPREREIARMIALGYSNKIIADVLEISLWTVATHLRRMFAKFGVTSRAALVASAITTGVLPGVGCADPDV